MSEVIFDAYGLVVSREGAKYYVTYDVGTHQIVMRKDEISKDDVARITAGSAEADKVLFELQNKLIQSGVDPYMSNIKQ